MLKKAITYTDFNNTERTEDFYFNLMQAELAEMELSTQGGFAEYLERIAKSNDGAKIISTFKEILVKAYGEKSEDGKRFVKSKELSEAFEQTQAYSVLFMQLVTDPDYAAEFIRGIMPNELADRLPPKPSLPPIPEIPKTAPPEIRTAPPEGS